MRLNKKTINRLINKLRVLIQEVEEGAPTNSLPDSIPPPPRKGGSKNRRGRQERTRSPRAPHHVHGDQDGARDRHPRQGAAGRSQPSAGGLDRQEVPKPRACSFLISSKRATSASSAASRSFSTAAGTSSAPTPPGGSARRSRAPSPIARAPSAFRCTWSRRPTSSSV